VNARYRRGLGTVTGLTGSYPFPRYGQPEHPEADQPAYLLVATGPAPLVVERIAWGWGALAVGGIVVGALGFVAGWLV